MTPDPAPPPVALTQERIAELQELLTAFKHQSASMHARFALSAALINSADALLSAASSGAAFKCKARGGVGANDPQDCDWPMCGCDPYADKVIAVLQESGALGPSHARAILKDRP